MYRKLGDQNVNVSKSSHKTVSQQQKCTEKYVILLLIFYLRGLKICRCHLWSESNMNGESSEGLTCCDDVPTEPRLQLLQFLPHSVICV